MKSPFLFCYNKLMNKKVIKFISFWIPVWKMKINFMPKTRLAKWSTGFGVFFTAFMIISPILTSLNQGQEGDETQMNYATRPFLIVLGLLAMASGLLAFVTGIISLFKYKERTILIYITTFIGLLAVVFLFGEFLFPH